MITFWLLIIEDIYDRIQHKIHSFGAFVIFGAIIKQNGRFNCFVELLSTIRMNRLTDFYHQGPAPARRPRPIEQGVTISIN